MDTIICLLIQVVCGCLADYWLLAFMNIPFVSDNLNFAFSPVFTFLQSEFLIDYFFSSFCIKLEGRGTDYFWVDHGFPWITPNL